MISWIDPPSKSISRRSAARDRSSTSCRSREAVTVRARSSRSRTSSTTGAAPVRRSAAAFPMAAVSASPSKGVHPQKGLRLHLEDDLHRLTAVEQLVALQALLQRERVGDD